MDVFVAKVVQSPLTGRGADLGFELFLFNKSNKYDSP